jgi:hemerythrin-like domain-containing protein
VRDLIDQVRQGTLAVGDARAALHRLALRQNAWTLGAFCLSFCTLVTQHHGLEDTAVFPHLRRAEPALAPVIDRLEAEHAVIHEVVESVDRALVDLVGNPSDLGALQGAVDRLTAILRSHLTYEEDQLVEPLSRHGFHPGQT